MDSKFEQTKVAEHGVQKIAVLLVVKTRRLIPSFAQVVGMHAALLMTKMR